MSEVGDHVLSLCDRSGVMVEPWLEAGFPCTIVDVQHPAGSTTEGLLTKVGADVRDWSPPSGVGMVFAFPPCTHLAQSGARWFKEKGLSKLAEGIALVESCREICEGSGAPWLLENPVGQLSTYWRKPDAYFDPCDFGGWYTPPVDQYRKKTCLWIGGGLTLPEHRPVEPVGNSPIHWASPGPDRGDRRSVTPRGFARAVFEANRHHLRPTPTLPAVLSVISAKSNGPLIAAAARLYIKPTDVVMDVTYGRGRWHTDYRHPGPLITHDLRIDGVDFRNLPEPDGSIDVILCDPPYTAMGGRATSTVPDFTDRYGLFDAPATPAEAQQLIDDMVTEAHRVLAKGGRLMVKVGDYVSSGKLVLGRHHTVTHALGLGLEQLDEFIHASGTGPQPTTNLDGTPRRQVHSRRAHSFLLVFGKVS